MKDFSEKSRTGGQLIASWIFDEFSGMGVFPQNKGGKPCPHTNLKKAPSWRNKFSDGTTSISIGLLVSFKLMNVTDTQIF